MSGSNDMLAQSLLAQLRQRPQQSTQARLAEQMMQQAGAARPIYNGGTGIAMQGIQGLLAGFMANRAQAGDQERQDNQMAFAEKTQNQRDERANSAFQAAMGGGAPMPMMQQPQPGMGMQPPGMQPAVMRAPMPPMGGGATAPPDLMPHFEAASRETGVPIELLIAKARQESNFNPTARGRAGEIGISQIMPSTARQPGFGVQPVDPATLDDPAANIMFGARYLAGRGRANGATDLSNPAQRDIALRNYNGTGRGGDPNYAANVSRFLPPAQPSSGAMPVSAPAPMPQGMPGAPDANMLRQRIQALAALNDPRATRQMQIDMQELGRLEAERGRQQERQFRLEDRAPEPLVPIQTPDGVRLVPRSAAVNQEPGRIDTQGAETFGSPVTEQGPDGRPIVVRYGNRGTRTVVAGAQPEAPRAGLNPTMGVDAAGNPVALLPRTDGTMTQPALPDGVTIMPRTREINTGTEILTVDQGGAVVARRPMDVAGRETQERIGQQAGADIATAPAALRTAEQSLAAIDGILNHPALRTATGLTSFTGGLPGTPMMDFRTRVDQLQGQAFLQAFESLKGGGAITQIEGEKATAAIARLNRSVSASDFRAALGELRDVINAGRMRALARMPNSAPPGSASNPAAPPGRLRFNLETGDIE